MGCLFCKIVEKQIPADILYEDPHTLAFRDIRPVAPHHVLVVPRRHVTAVHELTEADADVSILGHVMTAGRKVAHQLGLDVGGYRLVVNDGEAAGQSVHHLHLHVLGGRPLSWPPG